MEAERIARLMHHHLSPLSDRLRLQQDIEDAASDIAAAAAADKAEALGKLKAENERLTAWVNDLQSGMYINCVYCGHRYGPDDEVPSTMAEVLKQHVEQCPKHPMSALKAENDGLRRKITGLEYALEMAEAGEEILEQQLYSEESNGPT